MLFSSIPFLILFLPVVLLIYYYCPILKAKNIVLFIFSLLFYAWGEPKYIIVMVISILFNYRMGLFIADSIARKKFVLGLSIICNLLILFYFKYLDFSVKLINPILEYFAIEALLIKNIIMPIGISFYTFQCISYLIDIYKTKELVQKNLFELGLFITFFPQLIAGPIVRYHDINKQIAYRGHNISNFVNGIERFIIGLAKKVLLANTMAQAADGIFDRPFDSISSFYAWTAIIAYTFQIYYDFSGYSDMAIGLGKMFGFNIFENFNYPYASKSIREFWRRWHISLSSWFKDYLYIPLGGNKKGKYRMVLNLYIVFFVTGLWHGAATNFIFWGLGHGTLAFLERIFGPKINTVFKDGIGKAVISHTYTLFSVILLWVLFRLNIRESLEFFKRLFGFHGGTAILNPELKLLINSHFYTVLVICILAAIPWKKINEDKIKKISGLWFAVVIKYCLILAAAFLSMCALASNAYNPFIYFRF
jgi:alginate O-acetyltransferase complex protein AlgI